MEKAQFYEIFATHTHKTLGLVRLVSFIFKGIELFSVDWWLRDIIVSSKPTTINEFFVGVFKEENVLKPFNSNHQIDSNRNSNRFVSSKIIII